MNKLYDNFEEYWADTWVKSNQPAVLDLAFKEIAQKAWQSGFDSCLYHYSSNLIEYKGK